MSDGSSSDHISFACIVVTGASVGTELTPSSECSIPLARSNHPVRAIAENAMFHPPSETFLYTLSMLVCVAGATRCELHEEILEGLGAHPGTAFMQAQPFVAQWLEAHPGYVMRRWRLLPGRGA